MNKGVNYPNTLKVTPSMKPTLPIGYLYVRGVQPCSTAEQNAHNQIGPRAAAAFVCG